MTAQKKEVIKKITVSAWHGVISRINLNTIFIALLGLIGTVYQVNQSSRAEAKDKKEETVARVDSSWRKKSETRWLKLDSNLAIIHTKLDSINSVFREVQ